jgi:hypothetical protein
MSVGVNPYQAFTKNRIEFPSSNVLLEQLALFLEGTVTTNQKSITLYTDKQNYRNIKMLVINILSAILIELYNIERMHKKISESFSFNYSTAHVNFHQSTEDVDMYHKKKQMLEEFYREAENFEDRRKMANNRESYAQTEDKLSEELNGTLLQIGNSITTSNSKLSALQSRQTELQKQLYEMKKKEESKFKTDEMYLKYKSQQQRLLQENKERNEDELIMKNLEQNTEYQRCLSELSEISGELFSISEERNEMRREQKKIEKMLDTGAKTSYAKQKELKKLNHRNREIDALLESHKQQMNSNQLKEIVDRLRQKYIEIEQKKSLLEKRIRSAKIGYIEMNEMYESIDKLNEEYNKILKEYKEQTQLIESDELKALKLEKSEIEKRIVIINTSITSIGKVGEPNHPLKFVPTPSQFFLRLQDTMWGKWPQMIKVTYQELNAISGGAIILESDMKHNQDNQGLPEFTNESSILTVKKALKDKSPLSELFLLPYQVHDDELPDMKQFAYLLEKSIELSQKFITLRDMWKDTKLVLPNDKHHGFLSLPSRNEGRETDAYANYPKRNNEPVPPEPVVDPVPESVPEPEVEPVVEPVPEPNEDNQHYRRFLSFPPRNKGREKNGYANHPNMRK